MTDLRYILDKEEAEFGVGLYFKRDGEDKPQIIIRFLSYNCLYDGVTEMEKTGERKGQKFRFRQVKFEMPVRHLSWEDKRYKLER